MNALYEAKTRIQDAYYDERGMADVMRQDAAVYAQIAVAEELAGIRAALEKQNEILGRLVSTDEFTDGTPRDAIRVIVEEI